MRTMNALGKTTVEPGHLGGVHTTLEKFLKNTAFILGLGLPSTRYENEVI